MYIIYMHKDGKWLRPKYCISRREYNITDGYQSYWNMKTNKWDVAVIDCWRENLTKMIEAFLDAGYIKSCENTQFQFNITSSTFYK